MDHKEQVASKLLWWALFVCQEVESQYERLDDDEIQPPTWLAELRAACDQAEAAGWEGVE